MNAWLRRLSLVCGALSILLGIGSGCVPKIGLAPTHEPITIRFAYREHTAQLQSLFDAFHEKYPWITIDPVEAERWGDQAEMMLRSGVVDVLRDGREALSYAQDGLLRPLDDIQLGDWAGIRDDYYRAAWEGLSVQGQQWGVPVGMDMLVVYVNMSQARALKVDVPEADWSLFEFVELATKLNYPDGLPHAETGRLFGYCTTLETVDPIVFIYLHGGKVVNNINAPTEATLDNPLTIEAVQWYSDLYNLHNLVPDAEVIGNTFRRGGIYEAQMRGACGVWLGWYSSRGGLDMPFEWTLDWRMLPLPRQRAEFGVGDVEGYFITKDCAHPKEALLLLRFLANHWEASGQKLPPRRSMVNEDSYEEAVGEDVAAIARTFSDQALMMPVVYSESMQVLGKELTSAIEQIVTEDLDAASVLAEAQDRVRTVFESP